jgi:hypothetical protein
MTHPAMIHIPIKEVLSVKGHRNERPGKVPLLAHPYKIIENVCQEEKCFL